MAKRRQSERVYENTRTMMRDIGTTRDGSELRAQCNGRPLEEFVQPETVTTHSHFTYSAKTGNPTEVIERNDIIKHAQKSTARLTMARPATGNLRRERLVHAAKAVQNQKGFGDCMPMGCDEPAESDWNRPGSPAPTVPLSGGMRKPRSY